MPVESVGTRPSPDVTAVGIAVHNIGGRRYQAIKVVFGDADTATPVTAATPLPVSIGAAVSIAGTVPVTGNVAVPATDTLVGAVNEAAPVSDIANSGLNGRLQRIAQRLSSLIALMPTALTALGALKTGPAESTITYSVAAGSSSAATAADLAGVRNAALLIPATFDGSVINFYGCNTIGGTFLPIYDINNQPVALTCTASRIYDIPGEVMALRFIHLVTGTVQATTSTDFIFICRS